MPGRDITDEGALIQMGYGHPEFIQRRRVLRETLAAFASTAKRKRLLETAENNVRRWFRSGPREERVGQVKVFPQDWGEVTSFLTKAHGRCFAVLNMANAFVPGGAYVEGAPAQEENMYRRSDCHFSVDDSQFDQHTGCYVRAMTDLISATSGRVYLDTKWPRVCVRGPEDRSRDDLGYRWLGQDEIFPFFELRSAAQDLRGGLEFSRDAARKRIAAQLDTLIDVGVRHVVLGAFGCGAFENPAEEIAEIYSQELDARRGQFSIVAFAIVSAGYGPNNYEPFAKVFSQRS